MDEGRKEGRKEGRNEGWMEGRVKSVVEENGKERRGEEGRKLCLSLLHTHTSIHIYIYTYGIHTSLTYHFFQLAKRHYNTVPVIFFVYLSEERNKRKEGRKEGWKEGR
jgi:hypothetical protein